MGYETFRRVKLDSMSYTTYIVYMPGECQAPHWKGTKIKSHKPPWRGLTKQRGEQVPGEFPQTTLSQWVLDTRVPPPPDGRCLRCPDKKPDDHVLPAFLPHWDDPRANSNRGSKKKQTLKAPHENFTGQKAKQGGCRVAGKTGLLKGRLAAQRAHGGEKMPLTPEMAQSKSPSQSQTSYRVHKQLLAGLPNALQGHVHIFLSWEAIHAVVQGVWDSFGHLNTHREKSSMRKQFSVQTFMHASRKWAVVVCRAEKGWEVFHQHLPDTVYY